MGVGVVGIVGCAGLPTYTAAIQRGNTDIYRRFNRKTYGWTVLRLRRPCWSGGPYGFGRREPLQTSC